MPAKPGIARNAIQDLQFYTIPSLYPGIQLSRIIFSESLQAIMDSGVVSFQFFDS